MKSFRQYIAESKANIFNTQTSGKPRIDNLIHNAERMRADVKIQNVTPARAQELMAKAQGTTGKRAVERREKMPGFREKIDNLKKLIEKGLKLDVPYVEITSSGSTQDGFHRTIAAQELGIKKMPFVVIKHKGGRQ